MVFSVYLKGKNFKKEEHSLTVNITDRTEKIVLLFKKHKVIVDDSCIGYAIINRKDFQQYSDNKKTATFLFIIFATLL